MPYGLEIPRSIYFASSGVDFETVYAVNPGQVSIVKSLHINNSNDLYELPESDSFGSVVISRRGVSYPILSRTRLEPDETIFIDSPMVLEPGDLLRVSTSGDLNVSVNTYMFNMLELRA